MTGDLIFQILMIFSLLVILIILSFSTKLLFKKDSIKTKPDVEQKLDRIIELLENEANSKK